MIDQVASIIVRLKLVPVIFPRNRKHEIAYHRETYYKKHVSQVLQEENSKDTVQNKRQLDSQIQSTYIDKAGKDGIKYKITK